MGLDSVEASHAHNSPHQRQEDFAFSTASELSNRLQQVPVLVVGCKSDTIDKPLSGAGIDRVKRMTVNAKVLNELKKIDESSLIDYFEAGLSTHRGVYKVPQDDLQMYMCKLFQNELPLAEEGDEAVHHSNRFVGRRGRSHSASSVSESSDADDGAVKGSAFFRGNIQDEDCQEGKS